MSARTLERYVPIKRSAIRGLGNYLQALRTDLHRCNVTHDGSGRVKDKSIRHELSLLDAFIGELRTAQKRLAK